MQRLRLPLRQTPEQLVVLNLNTFLNAVELSSQNEIMLPGAEALRLSAIFASSFSSAEEL